MKNLTLIDKTFLLKKLSPFRTLSFEALLPIADKLVAGEFDEDDVIFEVKDEAHRMYIIVEGIVSLNTANGESIAVLEEGTFFGDEALFNDSRRAYSAKCKTDSLLLMLSQTNLFTIISEHPSVALGFLTVYSSLVPVRDKTLEGV